MKNKITTIQLFDTRYKRFIKKFPTLEAEMLQLKKDLLANPKTGTLITENAYKIRLASTDKNKGKSGGFRVITYLIEELVTDNEIETEIVLLIIYDKSEESSYNKNAVIKIIKDYL